MKVYRSGIVGVGFIGKVHLETARRLGNVEIIAIADKADAKAVAEEFNVPNYFDDYREMIDKMNLDMVHICTPNFTHFEIAMYAMEHGVNVICEKPMATSIDEARKMLEMANEKRLVAAVNFHNRFYPMTNHLMNIIKDGELGNVFSITGSYCQDWLLYPTDYSWRLVAAESGSTRAVADIGSHWMDLAEFVSGQKIVSVCADFQTIYKTRKKPKKQVLAFSTDRFTEEDYIDIPIDTEDNAHIMFHFSNGAKGSAFISQVIAGKSVAIDLLIGGYEKSAEWNSADVNSLNIGIRDESTRHVEKGGATVHKNTIPYVGYPFGHAEGFADAFKQGFREIYESIDNKDKKYQYATFEDGVHEMVLCEKIFESNKEHKWIDIPNE